MATSSGVSLVGSSIFVSLYVMKLTPFQMKHAQSSAWRSSPRMLKEMWSCGAFSVSTKAETVWRSAIVQATSERWLRPSNISRSLSLLSIIATIWSSMSSHGPATKRYLTRKKKSTLKARWSASTLCTSTWTWTQTRSNLSSWFTLSDALPSP